MVQVPSGPPVIRQRPTMPAPSPPAVDNAQTMPTMPGSLGGDVTDLPPMPGSQAPPAEMPSGGTVTLDTGLDNDLAKLYNGHSRDVDRQNQLLLIQIVRELQQLQKEPQK